MSHTTQCPHCKLEWVALDKIPAEFEFNLLKAENARLREALKKYANPETHSMDPDGFVWSGDYFDYETARAALEDER